MPQSSAGSITAGKGVNKTKPMDYLNKVSADTFIVPVIGDSDLLQAGNGCHAELVECHSRVHGPADSSGV